MFRDVCFLKKTLSVFVMILFMVTFLSTSAWGLSPKLEAKKNWLMAEKALEKENYSKAIRYLKKMESLKVALKPEYYFQYGRSLVKSGKFKEGLELLNSYIEKAGDEGEYVEWTLELMGEAEEPQAPAGMVLIPGGEYVAGENVEHTFLVDEFFIDKYEVTQADYKKVTGKNPSKFRGNDLPVETVNWHEAKAFCEKLDKRLPTEAEWEKAARGGTTTVYYWGDEDSDSYAWTKKNSVKKTHPVGQKKPNKYGLYDMAGNVWEWTADWNDKDYHQNAPRNNPKGPSTGNSKVNRGGSFHMESLWARSAFRGWGIPSIGDDWTGFRCAQ
jgi:sulfatase modifying factor 1